MRRQQVLIILFFLLASTRPAKAQIFDASSAGGPVTITAPWRFHIGDDPDGKLGWASPAFDDSHWQLLQTGRSWSAQGYPGYAGYGWYRLCLRVTPGVTEFGISFPSVSTSAEVFANGKLIGTIGRMSPRPVALFLPFVSTPFFALRPAGPGGTIEIAVRVWEWSHFRRWSPGGIVGRPLVGPLATLSETNSLRRSVGWNQSIPGMLLIALGLAVGLVSLALFLLQPRELAYGWAALYLIANATEALLLLRQVLIGGSFLGYDLLGLLDLPVSVAWLFFVWSFVREHADMLLRAALAVAVLQELVSILFVTGLIATPATDNAIYAVGALAIAVIVFVRLLRSAMHGNGDARLLLIPFLIQGLSDAAEGMRTVMYNLGRVPVSFDLNVFVTQHFTVNLQTAGETLALFAIAAVLVLRFTRSARREQQLSTEMASAREVQAQLVPLSLPALNEFTADAAFLPAAEVGGDFYQVFRQGDGSAVIVIGDVSGKGLKAAMTGTLVLGALRCLAQETLSPSRILSRLNVQLAGSSDGGFVTCLVTRIAPDGVITLANAGHLAPYHNGDEIPLEPSLPLGITADTTYSESTLRLAPNDRLTFLSDGVVEARSASGELFGFDRTRQISTKSAELIAAAAQVFGQQDDITVLTLAFASAEVPQA